MLLVVVLLLLQRILRSVGGWIQAAAARNNFQVRGGEAEDAEVVAAGGGVRERHAAGVGLGWAAFVWRVFWVREVLLEHER